MSEAKRRPPYAPVKGLRDFFDRVTQNKQPSRVDRPYLAGLGVAANNEQHVVAALKFLGLIDEEGRPTPRFNDLYLKSAERKRSLHLLLRRAYPGLFTGELDLQMASRAELHDYFVRRYGMQGQMARKAAAVFGFLASLAGIPVTPALNQEGRRAAPDRPSRPATHRSPRFVPAREATSQPAAPPPSSGQPPVSLHGWPVALLLTPRMSEDEIVAFLRRVRRALARAAVEPESGQSAP